MRISLTTPDGRLLEIDPTTIVALEQAMPGEWTTKVSTIVYFANQEQGVQETIDAIRQLEANAHARHAVNRLHESEYPRIPGSRG